MRGTAAGFLVVTLLGVTGTTALAQDAAKPAAQATNGAAAASTDPAAAQPSAEEPTPKPVTLTAGLDFVSAYMFRGLFQEDSGVIVPPYVDVGVTAYSGDGALKSVTINGGIWNSLHSGPSGSGNDDPDRNAWYEADFYGSVTFQLGKWKPGALFTSYTSPNDAFNTVNELAAVLAYDDSGSAVPLNPKVILAQELKGHADGFGGKGTYLELGVRPVFPLAPHDKYPLTLAVPAKMGLSLKNYYESADSDDGFGYFDLGGILSVPLAFMNGKTTWEIHGGVDILWLNGTTKALNGGDGVKAVGVIGFSMIY